MSPKRHVSKGIQQFPSTLKITTVGTASVFSPWDLGSTEAARAVILADRTCEPARESRRPRPSGGGVRAPPLPRSSLSSACKCFWAPEELTPLGVLGYPPPAWRLAARG